MAWEKGLTYKFAAVLVNLLGLYGWITSVLYWIHNQPQLDASAACWAVKGQNT